MEKILILPQKNNSASTTSNNCAADTRATPR